MSCTEKYTKPAHAVEHSFAVKDRPMPWGRSLVSLSTKHPMYSNVPNAGLVAWPLLHGCDSAAPAAPAVLVVAVVVVVVVVAADMVIGASVDVAGPALLLSTLFVASATVVPVAKVDVVVVVVAVVAVVAVTVVVVVTSGGNLQPHLHVLLCQCATTCVGCLQRTCAQRDTLQAAAATAAAAAAASASAVVMAAAAAVAGTVVVVEVAVIVVVVVPAAAPAGDGCVNRCSGCWSAAAFVFGRSPVPMFGVLFAG